LGAIVRRRLTPARHWLARLLGAGAAPPALVPPRVDRDRPQLLSLDQERLWFFDQALSSSTAYHPSIRLALDGGPHPPLLRDALRRVVRRHEPLRTRFVVRDGQPLQYLAGVAPLRLAVVDLTRLGRSAARRAVDRIVELEAARPFDLAAGDVARAILLRRRDGDLLLLGVHHLVIDLWSLSVLGDDLAAFLGASRGGVPSPLPPLPAQIVDYAAWQRARLDPARLEALTGYWWDRLAGVRAWQAPADHARPRTGNPVKSVHWHATSERLADGLRALSRREGVTLYTTLLAAFHVLLARWGGCHDVVVTSPTSGRVQPWMERATGFFVRTLWMRSALAGAPAVAQALAATQRVVLDAFDHGEAPFEVVNNAFDPAHALRPHPLRQLSFALHNAPLTSLPGLGAPADPATDRAGRPQRTINGSDLQVDAFDGGAGPLRWSLAFDPCLLSPGTAQAIATTYTRLLEGFVAAPDRCVWDLPLHDGVVGDRSRADRSHAGVVEAFVGSCRRTPDAVAVVDAAGAITFATLERDVARLARRLRGAGAAPERCVAVLLPWDARVVRAMLATLAAGAAFCLLDPGEPPAGLRERLRRLRPAALVTCRELYPRTHPGPGGDGVRVVLLGDQAGDEPGDEAGDDRPWRTTVVPAAQLAAVVLTPHGPVEVEHGALSAAIARVRALLGERGPGRTVGVLPGSSAGLVLAPLVAGAPVSLLAPVDGAVGDRRVDVLAGPVTVWEACLDAGWEPRGGLAICEVGGQGAPSLSGELCERLRALGLEARGLYGCALTGAACLRSGTAEALAGGVVPLGLPAAGTAPQVLDGRGWVVSDAMPGELAIGGAAIARGFRDRPARTAMTFVPVAGGRAGARAVLTGEVVRRGADGLVRRAGPAGDECERSGLRVRLSRVEAALRAHPAVESVAVEIRPVTVGAGSSTDEIVAYLGTGRALASEDLRAWACRALPWQAVPDAFVRAADGQRLARRAEPPAGATERAVAALWADVLGCAPPSLDDDFFACGGDSLAASRLLARAGRDCGTAPPFHAFLARPTLRALARMIDGTWQDRSGSPGMRRELG
jgi:non-ribosomal peptide synthetase component F